MDPLVMFCDKINTLSWSSSITSVFENVLYRLDKIELSGNLYLQGYAMKILHVLAPGPTAGLEKSTLTAVDALNRSGFQADIAVVVERRNPEHGLIFAKSARARGLVCHEIFSKTRFDFAPIRRLLKLVTDGRYDIVHTHSYKTLAYLSACRADLPPLAATYHGATAHTPAVELYEWLQRLLLQRVDCLFVVSEGARNHLESYGPLRCKVKIVPNMLSEEMPRRNIVEKPKDLSRLLYMGRLSIEKGADVLVTALCSLKGRSDLQLTILGDGPERSRLQTMVKESGLENMVHFEGFKTNIKEYLQAADLLVMPSRTEGLPMALIEAAVAGLPVVASKVGGIPEIIQNGHNGILVSPDDPQALATAISEIIEDYARYSSAVAGSRDELMSRYGSAGWVSGATAAYRELSASKAVHEF